jgi:Cu(I)-responsive transcriptional regulator
MNIGDAAGRSGVPAKTIRYYEDVGLIVPARRQENGYRDYDDAQVETLRFLKHARSLGFPLEDCRELVSLYHDRDRASADVKAITLKRIADIDRKIEELRAMKRTLEDLSRRCHGDDRPDCPILMGLAVED